jgi:hypothetical protein
MAQRSFAQRSSLQFTIGYLVSTAFAFEEEFRSQNGLNAPLPLTGVRINQSGIQTAQELKTTKFSI